MRSPSDRPTQNMDSCLPTKEKLPEGDIMFSSDDDDAVNDGNKYKMQLNCKLIDVHDIKTRRK